MLIVMQLVFDQQTSLIQIFWAQQMLFENPRICFSKMFKSNVYYLKKTYLINGRLLNSKYPLYNKFNLAYEICYLFDD